MPSQAPVKLVIVKTGDAFPDVVEAHGDFEQFFQRQIMTALPPGVVLDIINAHHEPTLPEPATLAGIMITGSHSMVSDAEPWSERLKPWLQQAFKARVPMLGVCYGHQLMASAFGGLSGYHPAGRESGTFRVELTSEGQEDALFGQLPKAFDAHLTHAQSVLEKPDGASVLAVNAHDPHQALRYGSRQWSVQFHPEFTPPVMRAYLDHQVEALSTQGQNVEALRQAIRETPEATQLLTRFLAFLA
ncbi:glutamine amidotransferase [Halomonas sp. LS-001]